jgi:uncharacterized membrane protein YbhN (UPF0104 family)
MNKKKDIYWYKALFDNPTFKLAYLLILFGATFYFFFELSDEIYNIISKTRAEMIILAFFCCCSGTFLYIFIHFFIYKEMKVHISFPKVLRIMSIAQLGKYIPGKILFVGNYFLLSHEAGIRSKDIVQSFIISLSVWLLSASICSIPVISLLSNQLKYLLFFLSLIVAIVIHPKIRNWILSLLWNILERYGKPVQETNSEVSKQIGYQLYIRIALLYFLTWIIAGFGMYFVIFAFQPIGIMDYYICLSTSALSSIIGFIAIFAPVGLGVREFVGTIVLIQITTLEIAILTMIALRIISIVTDLTFALITVIFFSYKEVADS